MTQMIPTVNVTYEATGKSKKTNELGMRPMQERAYEKRGEQYLLIKSPPASGKSRALMFIALDKVEYQGLKQGIIVVPERSIGASFGNTDLAKYGFWADWRVESRWNLCDAAITESGKVDAVGEFLKSTDKFLVCTHATFRFAVERFGIEAFDDRMIAIDEFHHVSANPENRLGSQLKELLLRGKVHVVAMTGSYFRGDSEAVLMPEDEAKFATVTYTYYEQLNGYEYLKSLSIGYFFYQGSYINSILDVLNPDERTIVHIPNVNSGESTKDKYKEVERIIGSLGHWEGVDPNTGFQLVRTAKGNVIRIADLVDDDPSKRTKVLASLKDPEQANNRDHVNIIIALGMAKEGFDWIWCEHALTVGYRDSLTEVVQIIGRATRDAPGKTSARFTNLIAEPDASQQNVSEAVNDTLKAISASLLMEQVLAPKFEFKPKVQTKDSDKVGEKSTSTGGAASGINSTGGEGDQIDTSETDSPIKVRNDTIEVEIKGLREPKSQEAKTICKNDVSEIIADFLQDKKNVERGLFDDSLMPPELTVVSLGRIVRERYPHLDEGDQEAIREHAISALNILQEVKKTQNESTKGMPDNTGENPMKSGNTSFVDSIKKYALDVRELNIDMIESINPFEGAYSILSKTMNEQRLKQIAALVKTKRTKITPEDAKLYARRAVEFMKARGRKPDMSSQDSWEALIAEGARAFVKYKQEGVYDAKGQA